MINDFNSIAFAGYLCSGIYSGFLADKFGRKPMVLVSTVGLGGFGFIVAIFNNIGINVYIVGRFFMTLFLFNAYLRWVQYQKLQRAKYVLAFNTQWNKWPHSSAHRQQCWLAQLDVESE